MIERLLEIANFRYQAKRIELGLGIDDNALNMVQDVTNNGLREGIPIALARHNDHFIGPRGDKLSDRFEEAFLIGCNAILAGMVFLFGKKLNIVLPKRKSVDDLT